ncbi:SusC/RagA family TonB-linked outer membrane protein [Mangrovivirga sp. M17]|uniref:SusC/RagA family TonB-linked outer membrane protein n=1 Tax=Mangrovivirga halotolerans TaxID=2993936 RepID=A0ABT3RT38_9BACT|nr:SusC/RagA family TonB-linked outer membrane protein [Mangrovivirga halotolerans]MCX2744956.1 SusC/RagA family TonB-linked outer membrane protein [Mangrovivirga halotolerans]
MKRIFLLSFFWAISFLAIAQEKSVSGTVTGENGEGIPGVNVLVKGTTRGVVTDIQGNYSLNVPSSDAIIQITSIGYVTQEIPVGSQTSIDVVLIEDVRQLSEVVVTAIGVEKEQKALGYSVQSVSSDDMNKARESNVINSLSGKVAGAQITSSSGAVGASSRIVLRGPSSITGNNQPLFIVDGVPISNAAAGNSGPYGGVDFGNGAADINPDDIESVTVLKGPNAAALYGSRASNGAIVITTKSGKGTKGIGVAVNSSFQFDSPLRTPSFQNSYGQGSSIKSFNWIDGSSAAGGVDESWGPRLDVGYEFPQFTTLGQEATPWVSVPGNVRDIYETGKLFTNNVALTGGNDKGNFRLSVTNLEQTGTIPNTDLSRNTVSLAGGYNLTEKFRAEFVANYVKNHSDNRPIVGYSSGNPIQQTIWSGRNVDFNALKDYENLPITDQGLGAGYAPINWNTRYQNNPFWAADNINVGNTKNRLYGNFRLSYQILDWLSVFVRSGMDTYHDLRESKYAKGIETTNNGNGAYSRSDISFQEINTDFLITANKNINEQFSIDASFGGNRRDYYYQSLNGSAPELELPGVYNLDNVKSGVNVTTSNYYEQKRVNSLYGSAEFGYNNYLFLQLTARNDWSSTLPADENSYFYPSASLSAVVSDIFEMKSGVVDFLKVRASWAQVGNDTDPYRLVQTFAFFDPFGAVLQPTESNTLLNPSLKPEITTSTEFGLEATLFGGIITTNMTYYDAVNTDQIIPVTISGASGYTNRQANIGEMTNRGFEVQLLAEILRGGDFEWDVQLNWARNRNEVTKLAPNLDQVILGSQWSVDVQARPNERYGVLFGPAFAKDPEGNIIHEDGLPVISETSAILGYTQPDFTAGLTNTIRYKGVSLSVLIDGRKGGDVYSMSSTWGRYAGVLEETLLGRENGLVGVGVKNVGSDENPVYVENDVVVSSKLYNQRAYSNSVAESSVYDGSFIKLRQAQLSYTFPKSIIGNTPFKNLTLSVVGRNLAFLYVTVPHIDPETSFNSGNAQGLEFGQIPTNRSIGFNVNFNF